MDQETRGWGPVLRAAVIALLSVPAEAGQEPAFPGIPWGTPLSDVRADRKLDPAAGAKTTRGGDGGDNKPVTRNVERYGYRLEGLGQAKISECLFEFTDGRFSALF